MKRYASLTKVFISALSTINNQAIPDHSIVEKRVVALHIFDGGLNDIRSRLPSLSGAFCDQTATTH